MAWIKAYKGFNKDMTCRGFQFEEGKEYELPDGVEVKLCESGFHACEDPNDCFGYYEPGKSVFYEVELDATDETSDDSKRVGRRIRIGAALDVAKICKLKFEYVKEHCTTSKTGGYRSALNDGDRSALNGGGWSALNGGDGSALNGGYRSALNGGDMSALNGGGWSVMRGGINSRFKGGKWSVFAVEQQDDSGNIIGVKAAVVDGETIKPDTWYKLEGGEFVECGEDE